MTYPGIKTWDVMVGNQQLIAWATAIPVAHSYQNCRYNWWQGDTSVLLLHWLPKEVND
jgi:hypothetical protein